MGLAVLAAPTTPVLQFALASWKSQPAMRIEDAYKWLLHATLGGEHAAPTLAAADAWMRREWRTLGPPHPGEPASVPLCPDGSWLRVSLRPYKALGGDPEMLAAIFFLSAERFPAAKADFLAAWHALGRYLRRQRFGHLDFGQWKRLDREASRSGYPAIEHSNAYLRAYQPAYRVVRRELWMSMDSTFALLNRR